MRRFLLVVAMMVFCGVAGAQQSGWPAGPGHTVLTLWPSTAVILSPVLTPPWEAGPPATTEPTPAPPVLVGWSSTPT